MKVKKIFDKSSKERIISGIIIFLYAFIMFYIYLNTKAYSVDENTFYSKMESIQINNLFYDILHVPNYFGYGQLYWWIMMALGSFLAIRVFTWIMLVSVPICICFSLKEVSNATDADMLGALILYVCCPMSWFTGKIIGPEIMGWALGAWGSFFILYGTKKYTYRFFLLGGCLIGFAAGLKVYYLVLMGFAGLYVMLKEFSDRRLRWDWLLIGVGGGIGFCLTNPLAFLDFELYRGNLAAYSMLGGYSAHNIKKVLFTPYIEWDLVNSGGMNTTIISVVALIGLLVVGIWRGKDRCMAIASTVAIIVMVIFCSKDRFLGWYLMPVIFLACIIVRWSKQTFIILCINAALMYPYVEFQLYSKAVQISYINNAEEIFQYVDSYVKEYDSYAVYYYIDTSIPDIAMSSAYSKYVGENIDEIFFISEYARSNDRINSIYCNARYNTNGYSIIDKQFNISVIIHNRQ